MIKQLFLKSVIAKYIMICLWQADQLIDLRDIDKSQYFAQLYLIIVNY